MTIEKGHAGAVELLFGNISSVRLRFYYIELFEKSFKIPSTGVFHSIAQFFALSPDETIKSGKRLCFVYKNKLFLYKSDMFSVAWDYSITSK